MIQSEILDRLPPQNLDAERCLLGSVLIDPYVIHEVRTTIKAADFYSPAHRSLFEDIEKLSDDNRTIDPVVLLERMKHDPQCSQALLAEIMEIVPHAGNWYYYAEIVLEKSKLRRLIHAATDLLRDSYDAAQPADVLSAALLERASDLSASQAGEFAQAPGELFPRVIGRIIQRLENPALAGGVNTGLIDLDRLTGGLWPTELIVLGARPSMGKTALACQIAMHVAANTGPIFLASLEMSADELGERMIASLGGFNIHKLRMGYTNEADRWLLSDTAATLTDLPIYVDDRSRQRVADIAAQARRLQRTRGLSLIVVDYLQRIEPTDYRETRDRQIAHITHGLKDLAKLLRVPVLALAQLSRQTEQKGKDADHRPRLSHLRESGSIEQDADMVCFLHRDEYYQPKNADVAGKADIIVAKARSGPTGEIKLVWDGERLHFHNSAMNAGTEWDAAQSEPAPFD